MAMVHPASLTAKVPLLLALLISISGSTLAAVWDDAYPNPEPILISLNETLTFHANETKLFFRTGNLSLDPTQCLEYHYFLKGQRTRLYVYTCRLSPGGRCVFHKFRETDQQKHCHYLSPWMRTHHDYAFFFHFVRRPRTFRSEVKRLRHLKRVRRQKSFPVVGRVELHGLKPHRDICRTDFSR